MELIDKEKVIQAFNAAAVKWNDPHSLCSLREYFSCELSKIPVCYETSTGWQYGKDNRQRYKCDKCGYISRELNKYCPNCGKRVPYDREEAW